MHDINASLERLSVINKPLTENTSDTDHILEREAKLRKDIKVKFTLGNSEELKSATLIYITELGNKYLNQKQTN